MAFSRYDFEASVERVNDKGINKNTIVEVLGAWGGSPEGGGSWEGGFLLRLTNGSYAYLTGWCDYTGWGCRDGVNVTFFTTRPALEELHNETKSFEEGGSGE